MTVSAPEPPFKLGARSQTALYRRRLVIARAGNRSNTDVVL